MPRGVAKKKKEKRKKEKPAHNSIILHTQLWISLFPLNICLGYLSKPRHLQILIFFMLQNMHLQDVIKFKLPVTF